MINPHDIILAPYMTEKGTDQREVGNKYAFRVSPQANKIEIAKAVEIIFNVKVRGVNIIRMHGKRKRVGWRIGRTGDWKKAVVTLKEGDSISIFEGA
jgi:large subunit ribosomal protein L23